MREMSYVRPAKIAKARTPAGDFLDLSIRGLTPALVNTLGMNTQLRELKRNTVVFTAGDANCGVGTAFPGTIINAFTDYQNAPDVAFRVTA
jgi:hypothetical protein